VRELADDVNALVAAVIDPDEFEKEGVPEVNVGVPAVMLPALYVNAP
jgi:hypothetical protein